MKYAISISVAVILLLATAMTAKLVINNWFKIPKTINACKDSNGLHRSFIDEEFEDYQTCIKNSAKLYLEKDYAESKDLAKTFLTLLSAILVASITFSEKIVDISKAKLLPLSTMIVCWSLLMAAIIFCGSGLAFMTTAAGIAAYNPELDYWQLEARGVNLFLSAGVAFVFALIALIIAGISSLVEKRAGVIATSTALAESQAISTDSQK